MYCSCVLLEITFHLGAKYKFIDCQSPFGIWMNWRSGEFQHGSECTATRTFVEELLPAVLETVIFFRRLGNQVHWSDGARGYRDHRDLLVSKRDEFQLVKRQGPACLAIASYSVKRYKRLRIACTALHCVLDWRFWAQSLRNLPFIKFGFAGAEGNLLPAYSITTATCTRQDGHHIESRRLLQDLSCREKGGVPFKISVSDRESGSGQVETGMEQPAGS